MKISRFRLKPGAEVDTSKMSEYANFIHVDATRSFHQYLADDICLYVGFPEDLSKWDDFDYVLVLDDDFGQPYTPFYSFLSRQEYAKETGAEFDEEPFPFLKKVIDRYNLEMEKLPYLEKI